RHYPSDASRTCGSRRYRRARAASRQRGQAPPNGTDLAHDSAARKGRHYRLALLRAAYWSLAVVLLPLKGFQAVFWAVIPLVVPHMIALPLSWPTVFVPHMMASAHDSGLVQTTLVPHMMALFQLVLVPHMIADPQAVS